MQQGEPEYQISFQAKNYKQYIMTNMNIFKFILFKFMFYFFK